MIISHKYKFIFIKTRKTAGTSIEVFLSNHCSHDDILTPIIPEEVMHSPRNYGNFFNHIKAFELKKSIHENIWNDYFKFCVERNPWDKMISYYYMQRYRSGNKLTIEDFFSSEDYCSDFFSYADPESPSKIIVDKIMRYESLSSDLEEFFNSINIPFNGDLGFRCKSGLRNDGKHYRDILSKDQAKIVSNVFSREIDHFGYTF